MRIYNQYKKANNLNRKVKNIVRSILALFALLGIVSGILALFDFSVSDWFKNAIKGEPEYVDVYLVPGDEWSEDGSSYGAWCWNDSGVPAASFVLATDEDEDGVFELKISKEYTSMLFVDLVPDATDLGAEWKNKRAQTDNLTVPEDENVYYHAYASQWSDKTDMLFNVTTEEVTVYFESTGFTGNNRPMMYVFDKTGKAEAKFIEFESDDDITFYATVPVGYTHLIFLSIESIGLWESVDWQSEDLVIPIDDNVLYVFATQSWTTLSASE